LGQLNANHIATLRVTPQQSGDSSVVPFSSSFFGGRLLNVLHHEVRSRRDDAGSGDARAAGWGSPLRTRGVCKLFCVPAGMAGGLRSVAALQTAVSRARVDRSVSSGCCAATGGPRVGRRQLLGPRCDVVGERECARSQRGAARIAVGLECAAGWESNTVLRVLARAAGFTR
jgi:hypothetical protein